MKIDLRYVFIYLFRTPLISFNLQIKFLQNEVNFPNRNKFILLGENIREREREISQPQIK